MTTIDRNDLAAFRNRRYAEEPWLDGKTIRVQSLTEKERAEIEAAILDGSKVSLRARIIAKALVDEDGHRLFADSDDDLQFLEAMDSRETNRLYEIVNRHCSVAPQNDIEEQAKNYEETPDVALQSV